MKNWITSIASFGLLTYASLACAQNESMIIEATPAARVRDLSVSLSLPYLLTLDRRFGINQRSYFEAFAGVLPISSLLFLDTKPNETGFSDSHEIVSTLSAWTVSSGLRYGRYLSSSWSLLGELGLIYVHGGAQLHLKNIENGTKIPFMNVGATLVQPVFGLAVRKAWNRWSLSVSMNVFIGSSVSIKKSGWFPSFQEVAPEYKTAIDDGSDALERSLRSSINHLQANFNLLPGLAVSYRF